MVSVLSSPVRVQVLFPGNGRKKSGFDGGVELNSNLISKPTEPAEKAIFPISEPLFSFSFLAYPEKGSCIFLVSEINKVLDYEVVYEANVKVSYFPLCFPYYP